MIVQPSSICKLVAALCLLLLLLSGAAGHAQDAEGDGPAESGGSTEEDVLDVEALLGTSDELPAWLKTPDGYVYKPAGKPDPFRPFIRQAQPAEAFRPMTPQRPLTPLERIEVGQLRVVGIVSRTGSQGVLAMVEMPDGKGYVLRPGVAIGRHGGVVRRITATEVIIQEQGHDITGKEQTRDVVLKINPTQGDTDE